MSDPVTPMHRQDRPELSLNNADFAQLWGVLLMFVAYGVVATLCLQCFAMFVKGFKAKRSKWRWDGLLILYVVLVFVVSTIYTGAIMQVSVVYFIDIDYPDFLSVKIGYSRLDDVSCSSLTVSGLLSDALLVSMYRFYYLHGRN